MATNAFWTFKTSRLCGPPTFGGGGGGKQFPGGRGAIHWQMVTYRTIHAIVALFEYMMLRSFLQDTLYKARHSRTLYIKLDTLVHLRLNCWVVWSNLLRTNLNKHWLKWYKARPNLRFVCSPALDHCERSDNMSFIWITDNVRRNKTDHTNRQPEIIVAVSVDLCSFYGHKPWSRYFLFYTFLKKYHPNTPPPKISRYTLLYLDHPFQSKNLRFKP